MDEIKEAYWRSRLSARDTKNAISLFGPHVWLVAVEKCLPAADVRNGLGEFQRMPLILQGDGAPFLFANTAPLRTDNEQQRDNDNQRGRNNKREGGICQPCLVY